MNLTANRKVQVLNGGM